MTSIWMSLSDEESLFVELFNYFKDKYFTVNMGQYENFSFGSGTLITPTTIIIGLMFGIMIAAILAVRDRRLIGEFVRSLNMDSCHSPDTAKTLSELGYQKNFAVRNELRSGKRLRAVVHCVELEKYEQTMNESAPEVKKQNSLKWDNNTFHYYIPAEKAAEADVRFEKKGTSWPILLTIILGMIVLTALVIYLLPDLLQMLDNAITVISG